MSLADPGLALAKAQEFLALLHDGWIEHGQGLEGDATAAMRGMLPLVRDIAARANPELAPALVEGEPAVDDYLRPVWRWVGVKEATQTLVGVLQNLNIREQILGPSGPTLAAEGLHPWVWHAAVDLWDDGHYRHAVNGAAAKVEEQTQLKLDREDLSGTKLYTEAFKLDTKPGERRLRFTYLTEKTADGNLTESWKSAHQGGMNYGQGCAQGIRNMNAHGTRELPEKEALEYLAALSVLARWVDTAQVHPDDPGPEPF